MFVEINSLTLIIWKCKSMSTIKILLNSSGKIREKWDEWESLSFE